MRLLVVQGHPHRFLRGARLALATNRHLLLALALLRIDAKASLLGRRHGRVNPGPKTKASRVVECDGNRQQGTKQSEIPTSLTIPRIPKSPLMHTAPRTLRFRISVVSCVCMGCLDSRLFDLWRHRLWTGTLVFFPLTPIIRRHIELTSSQNAGGPTQLILEALGAVLGELSPHISYNRGFSST